MEIIENKTKYAVAAMVFFVVVFAVLAAYQQKSIMALNKKIGELAGSQNALKNQEGSSPFTVEAVKKNLSENTKEIKGRITAKSEKSFSVSADIVDFSKLASVPEEKLAEGGEGLPKTKKNFNVSVNDKTQYPSLGFENLAEGMSVLVKSNELVYQTEKLTAAEIFVLAEGGDASSFRPEVKYIAGNIKEIKENYLVVEVNQIDRSKAPFAKDVDYQTVSKISKTYNVLIDDKTQFIDKGINEMKAGDVVKAYSASAVDKVSEFKAIKIEGPIPVAVPDEIMKQNQQSQ